jgi:glycosyltransferase involved in cell wall biosynthesis
MDIGMFSTLDVLHVSAARYPNGGGVEVLVSQMCNRLALNRAWKFGVCGSWHGEVEAGVDDSGVHFLNLPFEGLLQRLLNLQAFVYKAKPRIIHVHYLDILGAYAVRVAQVNSIPYIVHVHGLWSITDSPTVKQILYGAPRVLVPSRAVESSLHELFGKDPRIQVIVNGIADPRSTVAIVNPTSPSLAFVGRHSSEKGFDVGLRAVALLMDQFPNLHVKMVGTGPETRVLQELAAALGLSQVVSFPGLLSHDAALKAISSCDVLVIPSLREEGFSLVAAEAAMLEIPVVATEVGGLPETVKHEESGFLVQPGDHSRLAHAVSLQLKDHKLRRLMGKKARLRALEKYSIERFAAEIEITYRKTLGESNFSDSP